MILRQVNERTTKPYWFSGMQKILNKLRDELGLLAAFTLDVCRHGGMTELEEAALIDGQGRTLSAHKGQQAYEGYAKRPMDAPGRHPEKTCSPARERAGEHCFRIRGEMRFRMPRSEHRLNWLVRNE